MSPELEKLFFETADLEPAARLRYLDQHCHDPNIRAQVERLLRSDQGAEQFLSAPVMKLAGQLEQSAPDQKRVGPYQIVREIGRGGMGAVYEGERLDGEVRLKVAIKFVPPALRTAAVLDRFRQERQILANLNHPNIARLLDAGTTDDGSPYVVMELIEGEPIDRWCKSRHLAPRDVVAMFLPVCAAVSHAHQNLVVHRDLKPQNILVNSAGQPKLLDFGIAKLIDDAHRNLQTGVRALTPDYAAPEQIGGGVITTATDVYGLACVLYKLLTGATPKRDPRASLDTVLPRASTLRPELKGDLDNILAKALQPRPEQRYATAGELASELRRYLTLRPVVASQGGWTYSVSRFTRRNPALTGLIGALVAVLALGIGLSVWQSHRANQRFAEAQQFANRVLFQVDRQIRDVPGATAARRSVVATTLDYLNRIAGTAGNDGAIRRELASSYRRVSEIQWNPVAASLADPVAALASIQRAQELLGQPDGGASWSEYARIIMQKGLLDAELTGDAPSEAAAVLLQDVAAKQLKDTPPDLNSSIDSFSAAAALGAGRLDEARSAIDRALTLAREWAAQRPIDDQAPLHAAAFQALSARIEQAAHHPDVAAARQREAIDMLRKLRQSQPGNVSVDRALSLALAANPGTLDEAYQMAQRRAAADSDDLDSALCLQTIATRYAAVLTSAGRLDDAGRLITAVTNRSPLDHAPTNPTARRALAGAFHWLTEYRLARNDPDAAALAKQQAESLLAAK